jgi:asparagine N-glycosylation enzyme membrane subunit Stt3
MQRSLARFKTRRPSLWVAVSQPSHVLVLSTIIVAAGFVRVWGIGFGLPHLHHPDEWALTMPALKILQTGDLNPHRFDYGSLYIYGLTAVYGFSFLIGGLTGLTPAIHQLPIYEPTHNVYAYPYPEVYLIGRGLAALLGTLAVLSIYLTGRRFANRRVGIVAAAFLGFLPLHAVNSHFVTTDVPVTLFVTLSFFVALRTLTSAGYRDYALAGLFAGLTASVKYTGGAIVITLVMAHLLHPRRAREGRKLLVGLGCAFVGFALSTPFALADLGTWREWIDYVSSVYNPPGPMLTGSSARWYLGYLFELPLGLISLPATLGLIWGLKDRKREVWMAAAFIAVYFAFMSTYRLRWPRALMPLLPFLALLAAYFVDRLAERVGEKRNWRKQHTDRLAALIAISLLAWPLQSTIAHAHRFTQSSARTLAREWITENISSGAKIASDLAAPVLSPGRFQVDRVGWSILTHDLSWYQQEGFEYMVISSSVRYSINRSTEQEQQYQALLGDPALTLIATIRGHLLSYPDNAIWIYRLESLPEESFGWRQGANPWGELRYRQKAQII